LHLYTAVAFLVGSLHGKPMGASVEWASFGAHPPSGWVGLGGWIEFLGWVGLGWMVTKDD
jgi:hypothetical protein